MSQVCPTCNSALDPAHAPIARVRAARVVAYCSAKCANAADTSAGGVAIVAKRVEPSEPSEAKSPQPEKSVEKKTSEEGSRKAVSAPKASPPVSSVRDVIQEAQPGNKKMSSSLRKRVLWASGAIMLGGSIAVIRTISPGSPGNASASISESSTGVVTQEVASTPKPTNAQENEAEAPDKSTTAISDISPDKIRAAAISELEKQLNSGTPRFQRIAGLALARVAHPAALERLSVLLKSEDSDLARIDIAFGLARSGDMLGRAYLKSELASRRRDVRIDAGRRLAQLHDDAGRKALRQMLKVRTHKLGAASVLALLGDEEGLAVLHQTLAAASSSDENRMRAAVGLGLSGDDSVKESLLAILQDSRYVVDAAGALAVLGDSNAVPALMRQLELTSMRVSAAESLALMNHDVDLQGLASSLLTSNELGRTAAAEAILILTASESDSPED